MVITRADLQRLTRIRVREARSLLRSKEYAGAYYLTGLAIECALKSCIAKNTRRYDFPDRDVVRDSYSHDLAKLLKTAGLEPRMAADTQANVRLQNNWLTVQDWSIESRYHVGDREKAENLYGASMARDDGVLPWVKRHW